MEFEEYRKKMVDFNIVFDKQIEEIAIKADLMPEDLILSLLSCTNRMLCIYCKSKQSALDILDMQRERFIHLYEEPEAKSLRDLMNTLSGGK